MKVVCNLGRTGSRKYFKPTVSPDKNNITFLLRLSAASLTSWCITFEKAFDNFFRRKNNEEFREENNKEQT